MRRAERDQGLRPGLTTAEAERLKQLERENRELRRANALPPSPTLDWAEQSPQSAQPPGLPDSPPDRFKRSKLLRTVFGEISSTCAVFTSHPVRRIVSATSASGTFGRRPGVGLVPPTTSAGRWRACCRPRGASRSRCGSAGRVRSMTPRRGCTICGTGTTILQWGGSRRRIRWGTRAAGTSTPTAGIRRRGGTRTAWPWTMSTAHWHPWIRTTPLRIAWGRRAAAVAAPGCLGRGARRGMDLGGPF